MLAKLAPLRWAAAASATNVLLGGMLHEERRCVQNARSENTPLQARNIAASPGDSTAPLPWRWFWSSVHAFLQALPHGSASGEDLFERHCCRTRFRPDCAA